MQVIHDGCAGKKRYPTEDRAEVAARGVWSSGRVALRVYGCHACGGYHLTSKGAVAPAPKPGWRPARMSDRNAARLAKKRRRQRT